MEDEIERMNLLKTRKERIHYFISIVADLPNNDRILKAAVAVDPGNPDKTALHVLRLGYRTAKLDRDKLENLSKLYLEICPRVPGQGDVVRAADLIDHKRHQEAMEIVRRRESLSDRWRVSMQFQGVRAAFYDHSLAGEGKILCDEFMSYVRKSGLTYVMNKQLHRKALLVCEISFLFELRLAGWTPSDHCDDAILACIEKQFSHQW